MKYHLTVSMTTVLTSFLNCFLVTYDYCTDIDGFKFFGLSITVPLNRFYLYSSSASASSDLKSHLPPNSVLWKFTFLRTYPLLRGRLWVWNSVSSRQFRCYRKDTEPFIPCFLISLNSFLLFSCWHVTLLLGSLF